jgi:peroxiredoxin
MHESGIGQAKSESAGFAGATTVLLCVLVLSLGLNVYLWRATRGSPQSTGVGSVSLGGTVSGFSATDLLGRDVKVTWHGAPDTILYYFSPDCVWCKRNAQAIRSLHDKAQGKYRFIAVSPKQDGFETFAKATGIPSDMVLFNPAKELHRQLGLQATPDTFVIDGSGVLKAHWTGAYEGTTRDEILSYFNLSTADMSLVDK